MVDKVEAAEACGLGSHETAAELQALAREHAAPVARQLLVLAEEVAHLACADADVAGGHVDFGTDVAIQFVHEGLAEAHHLGVALAAGREVAAALAAAHGQRGQSVLEGLLEAQELQYREVDRGVEAQSALVGADGRVELHAVAQVHLHLALVVDPGHAERDDALGLHQSLDELCLLELGVLVIHFFDTEQHLVYGLQVLFLSRVFGLKLGHYLLYIHMCVLI